MPRKTRPQARGSSGSEREAVADGGRASSPPANEAAGASRGACGPVLAVAWRALAAVGLILLGMTIRTPALKLPELAVVPQPEAAGQVALPQAVLAAAGEAVPTTGPQTALTSLSAPDHAALTMRSPSTTTATGPPQLKLIINSHTWYRVPLTVLLQSLAQAGFIRWGDVVVFFGGSTEHVPPHDAPIWWASLAPAGVTFVNTTLNNYDFNAASGLYRYRDHPRVRANSYLYLLDSMTVGKDFPRIFDSMTYWKPYDFATCPRPCSNICAFGRGVVERYKENFDVNLSKLDGNHLEHSKRGRPVRGVFPMDHFADRVWQLRPREKRGSVDIYNTSHKRLRVYMPDWDVTKYILVMKTGDFGPSGRPSTPTGYR